ncbi:MAG: fluoride efflux transporter CrcB [Deltaproteobacteria bacterium]|nr:fluoride efflux transporter CrcB [Deltaproteobacteria bacterium]
MREVLALALAGAAGSLSRYGVGLLAERWCASSLPCGTLVVNVVGAFLLGVLVQVGLAVPSFSRPVQLALSTGFLGAFTTFSTFSLETVQLMERGAYGWAGLNLALNLALGLPAAWLGMVAARSVMS